MGMFTPLGSVHSDRRPHPITTVFVSDPPTPRIEHQDPRERLLMLYGVWVKCLPHQVGKRRLVERCIASCKAAVDARFGFPPRPWRGFEVDGEVQP